tara:strand:- start:1002 stop:1538 length:537 start_codon:yes stop_codon:yes gene_type:complete
MKFLRWLFSRFKRKAKKPPFEVKFDPRTEKNLQTLIPEVQDEIRKFVKLAKKVTARFGMEFKVISGLRTFEEQDRLYAKGRTEPGMKVTRARGGFSSHNYGIAIDGAIFDGDTYLDAKNSSLSTKIYKSIANNAEAAGLKIDAGVRWRSFPDPPHFEYRSQYSLSQMRTRKQEGLSVV